MSTRVALAFVVSGLFPLLALAVWMLRVAGPASRTVALGIYAVGLAAFVFAILRHRRSREGVRRGHALLKTVLAAYGAPLAIGALFLATAWAAFVLVPVGHAELAGDPPADLAARLDRDLGRLERSAAALPRIAGEARSLLGDADSAVDPDKKARLVRSWASYLDHSIELDTLVQVHQHFYRVSPLRHLDLNVRSFLVGYGALVAQLAGTARLIDAMHGQRDIETVLNEARPELGVPRNTYFRVKQRLVAPDTALRFHAGRAHLEGLLGAGKLSRPDERLLVSRIRSLYREVSRSVVMGPRILIDNPADSLEQSAFVAWFPMQKYMSESMGDTRTTRRPPLIGADAVRLLLPKLEPGDIVVERRNWYLSNIGLPGFWPHAALFTGTLAEQDAYFDASARQIIEGQAPSSYLSRAFPALVKRFNAGDPSSRVLEAVSEGVTLTSLEHSAAADYVAVLRPRLGKPEKLRALLDAYSLFGRPYDFNFDFVTDDAIVCSELVYKAYRERQDAPGLGFRLVRTADPWVLSPNDIIGKFDREYGLPGAQLDFVAFLDGSERQHSATSRDAEALRASWRRPKWDILQK
ncbi:MAG TPA: YiiX/YebB-like N1pC/P60 family cysteine hydrolase [Polyangiaceae bacterium]|nr:YiiX/YebB-like N1pC/P60 family cysteine hydrolase [Polyangiaceae bacterium]